MATKAELLHWMKTAPPIEMSLDPCQALVLAVLVQLALSQNDVDEDARRVGEKFLRAFNETLPPHLGGLCDQVAVLPKGFPPLTPSPN